MKKPSDKKSTIARKKADRRTDSPSAPAPSAQSQRTKAPAKSSKSVSSTAPSPEKTAALSRNLFPIVGVGASAGGLEAFTQFLKHLPANTGMGFVLVQHLDPVHESALPEILSRATAMLVLEVTNNLRVEPNHVYVIPPNTGMEISQGVLKLQPRDRQARGAQHSIDAFFESLAIDRGERAIGVVLSGTAADGTLGLEAIKAEGGITFAQDESAKFDSMPRNAIAAGCVDFVLSPAAIAHEVARIAQHPFVAGANGDIHMPPPEAEREADQREGPDSALASGGKGSPRTGPRQVRAEAKAGRNDPRTVEENGFKKILLLLRNHCGIDFSLYKSSTIQRRISRRMVLNRQSALADYGTFLRGNPKELAALYSDVLINVTSFFRNADAFEALKQKVFPALLAQRGRNGPVRVWTLGCSTGQEAYSIAMAFAEFCEKVPRAPTLQLFATDLNDAHLEKARLGLYAKSLAQDLSPERLRRFFVEEEGGYRISKALREQVVFARQNVMNDPPFSRMDLISCRNLLIYFEAGLQKKIMPAFHYALKPGGFLFLGASESIGSFTDLFEPVDKRQKIFSRKAAPTPSFRLPLPQERSAHPSPGQRTLPRVERTQGMPDGLRGEFDAQREADRLSVSQFAPPGVLVNAELQVLQFRGATSGFLEPPTGKASFDVLKMACEGLMLPLRAAIKQAKREQKTVRRENVHVRQKGENRAIHLQVTPLKNLKERCYLILFEDAKPTRGGRGTPPLEATGEAARKLRPVVPNATGRRVAELERELAETRDFLQSIQEQSEASTEELQASTEEAQSANEELQSLNEELETSKEELESTNEELTTVNEEMTNRNVELNGLNNDLSNLHVSIGTAILVLGRDLTLRRFTVQAEKIFNLLPTDMGRPISGFRHNLDCRDLETFVREVIDTMSVRQREVRDKEGRWYSLRARPYLTSDKKIDGAVLVLVDIDALKRSEQEIKGGRDYAQAILRTTPNPLLVLRTDLKVDAANEAFYQAFKVTPADTEGRLIYEIGNRQWNIPKLRELLEDILPRNSVFNGYEVAHKFETLGHRTMLLNARRMDNDSGVPERILLAIEDVTARKSSEEALRASEQRFRALVMASSDVVYRMNSDWSEMGQIDGRNFIADTQGPSRTWFADNIHPDDQPQVRAVIDGAIRTKSIFALEHRVRRVDGTFGWTFSRAVPLLDAQGEIVEWFGAASDITQRKEAEGALLQSERQLEGEVGALARLHELSASLWRKSDVRDGMEDMLDAAIELLGADMGNVQMLDPHKNVLEIVAQRGFQKDFLEFFREVSTDDDSACGRTLRAGRRTIIEDVETDDGYAPYREIAAAAGYRGVQSTPLVGRDGAVYGMLSTHFRAPHRPSEQELRRLDLYIRQAIDFIERIRDEQVLRESQARFQAIISQATVGIAEMDLTGKLTLVNERFCTIVGRTTAELIGLRTADITHPEDLEASTARFKALAKGRDDFSVEKRYLRPDGTTVWVSNSVSWIVDRDDVHHGFVEISQDISERKRLEVALQASEAYFRELTQSLPIGVWTSLPDGEVDFINRHWLEYTGQTFRSAMTHPEMWVSHLHPDDRDRAEQASAIGRTSNEGYTIEVRFRNATSGEYRWFLKRSVPVQEAGENLRKRIGVCIDIDDLKRAQNILADHAGELEVQVQNRTGELRETIGELEAFSYSVSHDMRAPLRAIQGFALLLLENNEASLDARSVDQLRRITTSAARMDALITDVLTYSRLLRSEIGLQPVNLDTLVRQVIATYPQLQANGAEIAIEGPLPTLLAHEASLTQVISNLLSNAVKFIAPGATARVHIHADEIEGDARLWIADNGIGIDPANHARIWNIFTRIVRARDYEGTGIGLSIVRKAVERMNGTIGLESVLGQGSTFWLRLRKS